MTTFNRAFIKGSLTHKIGWAATTQRLRQNEPVAATTFLVGLKAKQMEAAHKSAQKSRGER